MALPTADIVSGPESRAPGKWREPIVLLWRSICSQSQPGGASLGRRWPRVEPQTWYRRLRELGPGRRRVCLVLQASGPVLRRSGPLRQRPCPVLRRGCSLLRGRCPPRTLFSQQRSGALQRRTSLWQFHPHRPGWPRFCFALSQRAHAAGRAMSWLVPAPCRAGMERKKAYAKH